MYTLFAKRMLDVVLSFLLIISFSWLAVIIVMVYVFTFNLPILFRQSRIGRNNRTFLMYKFRTLRDTSNGPLNERRFWFGDVLRFFSLDELPQLLHVLIGQMSLVGPRALPSEYLALMNESQRGRHRVRPGITGWAQVNGRHEISWEKKFDLDLYYVARPSFLFDVKIMLMTVVLLFSLRQDKSLAEKKFEGTSSSRQ